MNFQDALKAAAKTPEELETERVDALSVKAEEEAIKVMKYAKRTLEKMASNAEYEEIDGKKVVSSLEPVMPDFFRHVKDDYKEVLNEEHYGFMGKNVKYMWTCTHNFYIEDNPVWTVFWDTVQKLAKQDNITVVPVYSYEPEFSNFIFNTEREHKIYMESDFPLTFQKQSQGNNTHPFGVVKSQEEHCYFLFKFRIKVT
ncbi:MAG: hypothetical protein LUC91_07800, partial [Prevotella sp.]|nr:hypothetical protein [Prevotella sp.]